jgi:signal transduction histidine kinase/CheY-like chemotaxis protein
VNLLAMIDRVSTWFGARLLLDADERYRLRFLVGSVAVGVLTALLSLLTLPASMAESLPLLIFVVGSVGGVGLLRLAVPLKVVVAWETLLVTGFLFYMSISGATLQPDQLYWFSIIPLISMLMAGRLAGALGALLAVVAATGVVEAYRLGYHGTEVFETTWVLVNFAIFLVAVAMLTAMFESLRTRTAVEAEQAARVRGLFLANVSHELRTPMNGVIGLTELLAGTTLDDAQRAHLSLLQRSGEAMVQLINDLLDLTRLESGEFRLEPASTSARELVADVSALFQANAKATGLALTMTVDAGVPAWVLVDGLRLRQVVQNLVGNAVKFTARGGVRVGVTWAGSVLSVSVADDGPGLSADLRARLFRPFQQGDQSSTRRTQGSGLGLAISSQLAQRMGGRIDVTTSEGQGSTFVVTVSAPACEGPVPKATAPSTPLAGGRLLVVEDNAVNQVVTRGLCQKVGFEVDVVENGQLAVAAVQAREYALVLMDCQMPVMDGYEATIAIRKLGGRSGKVPIVALTASAMREELDRCLAVGMNDVLPKPLRREVLEAVLRRFVVAAPT